MNLTNVDLLLLLIVLVLVLILVINAVPLLFRLSQIVRENNNIKSSINQSTYSPPKNKIINCAHQQGLKKVVAIFAALEVELSDGHKISLLDDEILKLAEQILKSRIDKLNAYRSHT